MPYHSHLSTITFRNCPPLHQPTYPLPLLYPHCQQVSPGPAARLAHGRFALINLDEMRRAQVLHRKDFIHKQLPKTAVREHMPDDSHQSTCPEMTITAILFPLYPAGVPQICHSWARPRKNLHCDAVTACTGTVRIYNALIIRNVALGGVDFEGSEDCQKHRYI